MNKLILIPVFLLAVLLWGCGSKTGADSPGEAVNNFVKAVKEKNSTAAWDNLSGESQKMYDKIAVNTNRSGKQYFEVSMEDPNSLGVLAEEYEIVDEKIDGDKATIMIKTSAGQTNELYAIMENGGWKFDYSRSIQESMKEKGTP